MNFLKKLFNWAMPYVIVFCRAGWAALRGHVAQQLTA